LYSMIAYEADSSLSVGGGNTLLTPNVPAPSNDPRETPS